ncbi:hypothetical protein QZM18_14040 [Burkholderia diffusa]|uniref:hypothetical protein n=1 Tax=Burkholderia diffusa TaxID=488732 RepID=UPI00265391A8|nr:hypothetical protein [Burkholderia diffusa]MDN7905230.1 hypothetical protein [Burkholderia diffusa]
MSSVKFLDKLAFIVSVSSGTVAAVAGGYSWTRTAIAAGCIAAVTPIINRWTSGKLAFAPRMLSTRQAAALQTELRKGPSFSLWLNHNRHEDEPAAFHAQLYDALTAAGLDVKWFGGLTNSTTGIEVGGPDIPEKVRIMNALKSAKIKFTNVQYTDAPASEHSPLNTVGVSISIGKRF